MNRYSWMSGKILGIFLGAVLMGSLLYCNYFNLSFSKVGNTAASENSAVRQPSLPAVPQNAVNVSDYGAIGAGLTDATAAIQNAVDAAAKGSGNVYIPEGTYMINTLQSIQLRDHINIYMTHKTILRAIPNASSFYVVLTIQNVSHVKVFGGMIQGDREGHVGTKGQWGSGVQISGAKDVVIQGTRCDDCWGDGFYIGTEVFTGPGTWKVLNPVPEDIQLVDVTANHNRRQGISIIAGRNVTVTRPILTGTGGQDPEGGLDIEPNKITDLIEQVQITDAVTEKNRGAGIQILLAKLAGSSHPVSITIQNHHDSGSKIGLSIEGRNAIVDGTLSVVGSQWNENVKNGLKITDHDYRAFHIDITNCKILNPNRGGVTGPKVDGAAVAIVASKGNVVGRTGCIGNVTVDQIIIADTQIPMLTVAPFHIWDYQPGYTIQNLKIISPVIQGSLDNTPLYPNVIPFIQ